MGPAFSDKIDEYVLLKLPLDSFKGQIRSLESGFQIAGVEIRESVRRDEKRLLKFNFSNWAAPYSCNLKGWKKDSPLYVLHQGCLVSGLYLCNQNEFEEGKDWGQLHYFFTAPSFKRRGIHSIIFREAILKAKFWNLQGVIINTDRYLLPEVYMKWGATLWKKIGKKNHSERRPIYVKGLLNHLKKY